MKQSSKDKIINQSIQTKLQKARQHRSKKQYQQGIQMYGKVLFLNENPQYLIELAQIYQEILDISTALTFYKRSYQLKPKNQLKQKIQEIYKIQGMQLLYVGNIKNILQQTQYQLFIKRYPTFHTKILQKTKIKSLISQHLLNCLAYLQVNYRQLAIDQIDNCLIKYQNKPDIDLIIFKGFIFWSIMEDVKGYKQFWDAYKIDSKNNQVQIFLAMILPNVQNLYKQAKYDLIEKKMDKCKLKVKKGLEMHPTHTQLLILSSFLHRNNQQYEQALVNLELAQKTLQNQLLAPNLKNQISLTYNQMGVYLYKQSKFTQAISLFTEGLNFKLQDWAIYVNRGDCYRALNQYIKALEDYLTAYSYQKKNQDLCFRIAGIYNIRGINLFNSRNFDLALIEFNESLKFSPRCTQFYLSKAKCLLQMNRKKQAVAVLEQVLILDPNLVEAIQLLDYNKQPQDKRGKNNRKIIYLSKQKS